MFESMHDFPEMRAGLPMEDAVVLTRALRELVRILNLNVIPPLYLIPHSGTFTLGLADDGIGLAYDQQVTRIALAPGVYNDYPLPATNVMAITASAPGQIVFTGFSGANDGTFREIRNDNPRASAGQAPSTIVLTNQDGRSLAADRLSTSDGNNVYIQPQDLAGVKYDLTHTQYTIMVRPRIPGSGSGGGGGAPKGCCWLGINLQLLTLSFTYGVNNYNQATIRTPTNNSGTDNPYSPGDTLPTSSSVPSSYQTTTYNASPTQPLPVYPPGTDTVNGQASGMPYSIPPRSGATFYNSGPAGGSGTGAWWAIASGNNTATGGSTAPSNQSVQSSGTATNAYVTIYTATSPTGLNGGYSIQNNAALSANSIDVQLLVSDFYGTNYTDTSGTGGSALPGSGGIFTQTISPAYIPGGLKYPFKSWAIQVRNTPGDSVNCPWTLKTSVTG